MSQEIIIEEYRALRSEICARLKLLHQIILFSSAVWVALTIFGFISYLNNFEFFYTYLLFVPLIFTGLTFNYQDNQRTLEATAKYIEEKLKPKLGDLEWEKYFAAKKKTYQLSSANKLFSLLIPLTIPIILLFTVRLNSFQEILSVIDLFFLIIIIANFRYKLYRIK